jgi:hypothetical protein
MPWKNYIRMLISHCVAFLVRHNSSQLRIFEASGMSCTMRFPLKNIELILFEDPPTPLDTDHPVLSSKTTANMRLLPAITATLLALPGALAQMCVGQGPGSCQFVMSSTVGIGGDGGFWTYLYDHTCRKIGEGPETDPGDVITSELPYTVIVRQRGGIGTGSNGVYAVFDYAGRTYGHGYTSYVTGDCSSQLTGCSYIRIAFDCPGF